jgi:hypothetical protein
MVLWTIPSDENRFDRQAGRASRRNLDMMARHAHGLTNQGVLAMAMDERGKAFESKWAHDAELRFKVEAKRNRALGEWVAAKKGLTGQAVDDMIGSVIAADFQEAGDEDVFRKLRSELDASVSDAVIREKMRECLAAAVEQVKKTA